MRPRRTVEAPYLKQLVDKEIALLPEYLQVAYKTPAAQRTEGQKLNAAQVEKTLQNDTLRAKITEKDLVPMMSAEEKARHAALDEQIAALDKQKPKPFATAMAIGDSGRERAAIVLPASRQHRLQGIADDAGRPLGRRLERPRRSRRRRPTAKSIVPPARIRGLAGRARATR